MYTLQIKIVRFVGKTVSYFLCKFIICTSKTKMNEMIRYNPELSIDLSRATSAYTV